MSAVGGSKIPFFAFVQNRNQGKAVQEKWLDLNPKNHIPRTLSKRFEECNSKRFEECNIMILWLRNSGQWLSSRIVEYWSKLSEKRTTKPLCFKFWKVCMIATEYPCFGFAWCWIHTCDLHHFSRLFVIQMLY